MKRCSNCGTKNDSDATYCKSCGSEFAVESSGGTVKWDDKDNDQDDIKVIVVGSKETMRYVQHVMKGFNSGSDVVVIHARGRAISKAVDVAEIIRHKFIEEAKITDIVTDTEEIENDEGRTTNVSSMEITMRK